MKNKTKNILFLLLIIGLAIGIMWWAASEQENFYNTISNLPKTFQKMMNEYTEMKYTPNKYSSYAAFLEEKNKKYAILQQMLNNVKKKSAKRISEIEDELN